MNDAGGQCFFFEFLAVGLFSLRVKLWMGFYLNNAGGRAAVAL